MSGIRESWSNWNPSKGTLVWSCAGAVVATMLVGFTWGGWVTGGSAREQAEETAESARYELASAICVERFMRAEDAALKLTSLKDMPSYRQSTFIREGDWAVMPDRDDANYRVASDCADALAAMELPPTDAADATATQVE